MRDTPNFSHQSESQAGGNMNKASISFRALALIVAIWCSGISLAFAQGAPNIVWEMATPNGLANSIVGVGWAPGSVGQVAMGSTDRWLRTRQAATGALSYSILGPQHSRGGDQTIYSTDGLYLAVHNLNKGLDYRVYRASDGFFLGTIVVTTDSNGVIQFTPDAQLQTAVPNAMSRFRIEEFTVVISVGSGYDITTTTFNFSPNGAYQSAVGSGQILIQSRADGSTITQFPGGAVRGLTAVSFTPNSTAIAAWDADSNQTTLWRTLDHKVLMQFPDAVSEEGVSAIRFTPDGSHLVTSGYLAFQVNGSWQQYGVIRFWRVSDGSLRKQFDEHTGIAVTSAVAWSPGATQFIYGTYEGTVVAARSPILKTSNSP
jgi:WD40 repeat protein